LAPFLAYLADSRQPVAVLPRARRRYLLVDPATGARKPVGPKIAGLLAKDACMFCRPLPEGPLEATQLLGLAIRCAKGSDLAILAVLSAIGGLLAAVLPITVAIVLNRTIPSADEAQLWQLCAVAAGCGLVAAALEITRNLAQSRLEARVGATLQIAFWDRLLRLPAAFFRLHNIGDLAERGMAIETIRHLIVSSLASPLANLAATIVSLAIVFIYNPALGSLAIGLGAVAIIFGIATNRRRLRHLGPLLATRNRLSGFVQQLAAGGPRLYAAHAELRALGTWGRLHSYCERLISREQRSDSRVAVLDELGPAAALIAVVIASAYASPSAPRLGGVVASSIALAQFWWGMLGLTKGVGGVVQAAAQWEHVRPLLQAVPEWRAGRVLPGRLSGGIEISHVTFRYAPSPAAALKDLSLKVSPGEFLALVGPSGSGKSTMLRLLLALESPETGTIFYDGQNLADLDVVALRQQIGVVLRDGDLRPGTILDNIVDPTAHTIEDAWEAARLAGLEEHIRALPMGMQTVVTEGASTFSGGQRQLVLLARALMRKPRILLLDEATSGLDNASQAVVHANLRQLGITRVIVAHRLSTMQQADRCCVLADGRIVQEGTYRALIDTPGLFADLARRQLS